MEIINKDEFLQLIGNEVRILKHLHSKITPEIAGFKLTENQRTTLELLRFMAHQGSSWMAMLENKTDAGWEAGEARSKEMTLEAFPTEIDRELAEVTAKINSWTEEQLAEEVTLWGMTHARKFWLVANVLAQFTAYRMQLFLQLKAAGKAELNTMNLWAGMDGNM